MAETPVLYGHPFSSYTWKAQIALHAAALDYTFRVLEPDAPAEFWKALAEHAGPLAKFPLLIDGESTMFEATCIIEYLALTRPSARALLPGEPRAALEVRRMDRVFDLYVMEPMQAVVAEYLRHPGNVDAARCGEARGKLHRAYHWLERWAVGYEPAAVTLIECAAAPSLFYADWVEEIPTDCPALRDYRTYLLALPEVSRCVEAGRPFRLNFPPGAPDRD